MASGSTPIPRPLWDDDNAERHRKKHTKCFERLIRVIGREVSILEFKARSQAAIDQAWAEFEARKLDNDKAVYYIDDELVQAVITPDRHVFRTCFHQHLDYPGQCQALIHMAPGDRRAKLLRYLEYGVQGGVYTALKRIRGV